MKPLVPPTVLLICAACLAWGQSADVSAKFEAADVHISAKSANPFVRSSAGRGGRYEIKTATMVDLIRLAYGFDPDKILGGPRWLEMDRYDVTAKVPSDTTPDTQKEMLQSLLAERFQLKVHKDNKPLPTYALSVGKKPLLKPADANEEPGCKAQSASGAPAEGGVGFIRLNTVNNGVETTLTLGPGMMVQYSCRNMTMASFVTNLRTMIGANVGTNPIIDETELKGGWDFDLKYSLQLGLVLPGNSGERVTVMEAIDKQLGLKLQEKQVPTPVLLVDSVNEKPTANAANVAEVLPPIPVPTEFDVASVKPSDPGGRGGRYAMQPGGRVDIQGMPLSFLVSRAFNSNSGDDIVGMPAWATSERFDITARAASAGPSSAPLDADTSAAMMRKLLVDRFKMTYHSEERQLAAYSLVAAKPKLKKADPESRTFCKNLPPSPGAPPGTRILSCQNATVAEFADFLQNKGPELRWPVLDATGIEGRYDFAVTFSQAPLALPVAGGGRGGDGGGAAGPAAPAASDPTGGLTLIEAVEKQLGLKLESQKRTLPVTVIDHIEQKPTDN